VGVAQTEEVEMFRGSHAPLDIYAGTWIVIAGMGLLALAGAVLFGFSFERASVVNVAVTAAIPGTLHLIYTRIRRDVYIGPVCGAAAILYLSSIVGGTISVVALGTGAPLIDAPLARLDAVMGFDVGEFVRLIVRLPGAVSLLRVCYGGIVPAIMLTAVILVLIQRLDRLWEFCFVYAGTLTMCSLISAFLPAIGAFIYYSLDRALLDRLPHEAGVYYVSQFIAFRFDGQRSIDLLHFDGVVNFPSFHCCMALLTAYAYRGFRRITALIYAFSGLVIISCIPIGGHYFSDVVGGAAVWGIFVAMTRLHRRAPMQRGPATADARSAGLNAIPEQPATQ
jgi:membrane-associated phospholipid phosphatase